MATVSSLNNSWRKLYATGNNMKLPEREALTKDGVHFRKRPEPEVVEHMLDDLEGKMRNYFILYNREREFRKKSEENCYRLEQELLRQKQLLDEAANKFHCLERKVKAMVDQPLKLKETIDRIDLLYNQMDTLIQAFVGVGSCAVIQGYSRVAFIKLCLEYLYPCRELDVRLNTLYNALYGVLTQYEGIEVTKNEVLKPMTFHEPVEKASLTGLSVKVHRLMLKCDLPSPDPKSFGCFFRYDHEDRELKATEKARFLSVDVKPLDNASKVYEFNLTAEQPRLPPKVPNVVPKLVLDVYADAVYVGSAEAPLISDKTLKPSEPWNVLDSNGVNCGDIVVTVFPVPGNAKLPAVNFAGKTDELLRVNTQQPQQQAPAPEPVKPQQQAPEPVEKPKVDTFRPSAEANKTFQPKTAVAARKPLFNPKSAVVPKPAAQKADKPQQASAASNNVSRLSMLFSGKKQAAAKAPEEPKQVPQLEVVDKAEKEKVEIKDTIVRKLSGALGSRKPSVEPTAAPAPAPPAATPAAPEPPKKLPSKQEPAVTTPEAKLEKLPSKQNEPPKVAEAPVAQSQPQQPPEKAAPAPPPTPVAQPEAAPPAPKVTKAPLPPPASKSVPAPPVKAPLPEPAAPAGETLPEKPLLPIVIAPKMLKKPAPPKKP